MKVLVRSDRVPITLMILGTVMCMVASLEFTARNADPLFILGWVIALLGFILWALPTYQKYLRKKAKRRAKEQKKMKEKEEPPRRYARPRR